MRDVIFREAERHLRYIKMSGQDNIGGPCPFHKGGREKNPSFYINLNTGLFHCHACKTSGTFIQFLKRMNTPSTIIDSIMDLGRREPQYRPKMKVHSGVGSHILNESLLGVFQYCPVDLVNEGFDEELLRDLEIGFDIEALRITFPIRDIQGNLVGLSGRTVQDAFPRYKVYKSKDFLRFAPDDAETVARYKTYEIKNHDYLWNMHNVFPSAFFGGLDTVILVEGYKACLWLLQNGYNNAIALQGSSLTRTQGQILGRLGVTVILFLDNDQAGKEGTYTTGWWLRRRGMDVKAVMYPEWCSENTQPDDLDEPVIHEVIRAAKDWHEWRNKHNGVLTKAKKLIRTKSKGLHYQT